ncbi:CidA/LrgA family protein [Gracilibacillus sp. HCP3S3_G5_1]|uniref:CidA/LrgA family protein n=1 Tax=unclassified Gracilibacillus TaxID=2625209 RepID=UPI003F888D07
MNYLKICIQIILLFGFLIIGEWLQDLFNLSISGSIIGMILLFLGLICKIIPENWIAQGSGFLISIISLLFVPSLVGLMQFSSLLSKLGLLLIITIVVSTILTMLTGSWISQFMEGQLINERKEDNGVPIKGSEHNSH